MTIEETPGFPATPSPSRPDESRTARVADDASAQASKVASTATTAAKEAVGEATTQAKVVAGEAKRQLGSVAGQTRDELRRQADDRARQAAGGLRTFADQVSALTSGRPEQAGRLPGLLDELNWRATSIAERLEHGGPQAAINDVSTFARRRPALFLAIAAGAGFAVGRFARAARDAQQTDGDDLTGRRYDATLEAQALPAPVPLVDAPPISPVL